MQKSAIEQLLATLPDQVEVDALVERLYLLDKIDRAEAQLMTGQTISHEEVRKRLEPWLK